MSQRGYLFLSKGPRYIWRFAAWEANRSARRFGLQRRSWQIDAPSFWLQLELDNPSLAEVAHGLRSGRNDEASRSLLNYFSHRKTPRFFCEWDDRAALSAYISSEKQAATVDAANRAARRTFCFRGQPSITFEGPVAWTYRPQGNTDWMWDLNRHFYFVTLGQAFWYTGDARYVQAFTELLADWLSGNPPDETHPNWADPFEVACRITTWLWAYHLFMSAGVLDANSHLDMLRGLWTHGAYLDACLELHVPNNHLLLEAKALAMIGLLLPEFRTARPWRERGLRILEEEVSRQICSDGVHAERVPHYQRLIASELLELLVLLDNNGLTASPVLSGNFLKMLEYERHITRPDGHIPLFGDSAHGDPHIRFAPVPGGAAWLGRPDLKLPRMPLDEMTTWLLGPERIRPFYDLPVRPPAPSRAFPEGGYVVMREGWDADGLYLAFDCGPFGYELASGHGHADALSVELYARGRPQLVDSGVYSYHLDQQRRNTFRGTRAHNTVVVDGQDQSVLLDTGRAWRPARVMLNNWVTRPEFDFVDASHDGYRRLPGRVTHRRQIVFVKPEYWLIVDWLEGSGEHDFEMLFHLHPGVAVELDPHTGATTADGLVIVPARQPGLNVTVTEGWVSFRSGERQLAPVVTHALRAAAPVVFQTLLYPVGPGTTGAPFLTDRSAELCGRTGKAISGATALQIDLDLYQDILIFDRQLSLNHKQLGLYETDARLTHLRCPRGEVMPSRVILQQGSHFAVASQPLIGEARTVSIWESTSPGNRTDRMTHQERHAG